MDRIFTKYKEIITYIIFGVLTTLVSWVSYALFANVCHLSVFFSNLFSWVFAVSFAFVTNKIWVFRSLTWKPKIILKEVVAFLSSRIFTGVIEIVSVPLLVKVGADAFFTSLLVKLHLGFDFLMTEGLCSKILISVVVIILNYILSKLFVFKNTAPKTEKQAEAEEGFVLSDFLFRIVNAVVLCLLILVSAYAITGSVSFFGSGSQAASKELILLFSIVILFFTFFFNKAVIGSNSFESRCRICAIMLFGGIALLQIIMLCSFDIEQTTDSYMINDQALALVMNGQSQVDPGNVYFQVYSNNNLTLVLTVWFYRILRFFGANLQTNLLFAILNAVWVDASIVLSYFAVKRMLGKKFALGFLWFNALNPLTYLFLFWSYTMVYSLPITALGVYLVSLLTVLPKNKSGVRMLVYCAIGAVCVLGYFIRPTVLIPMIAAAGVAIFKWEPDKKQIVKSAATLLATAAVCVLVFVGTKAVIGRYVPESDRSFPTTHWIMMGLTEDGQIVASDFNYTYNFKNTEEMKTGTVEELKQRLSSYTVPSFISHLITKLNTTWSDGTGGYAVRMIADVKQSPLNSFICGDRTGTVSSYCCAFRIATLLTAAAGLFLTLFRKKQDLSISFASITVFGAMLFYLVWEAKSAYSTPFIPFLFLLSQDFFSGVKIPARAEPRHIFRNAGIAVMAVTVVLGAALYAPLTKETDVRRYAVRCECNNWWLYTDYVRDLSESGEKLSQSFVAENAFNEIRLGCSPLKGDASYRISVSDENGRMIAEAVAKKDGVKNQFFTVKTEMQNPGSPTEYTVTIAPTEPGNKDSIQWHSKKALATDQYEGGAYRNGSEIPDINIQVLQVTSSPYLPSRMFFMLFGLMILMEFAAVILIEKKKKTAGPDPSAEVSGTSNPAAEPILAESNKNKEDRDMKEDRIIPVERSCSECSEAQINKKEERTMQPKLAIVIPCYNEEEVLPITSQMFRDQLNDMIRQGKISNESYILFVNDGSKDKTWEIIKKLSGEDRCFRGISQSRNRGHQNTLLAGLMEVKDDCDITISIDCDGQDEISAMTKMVDAYLDGAEVVYGVRSKRDTDTFFKRFTAESFYKLLNMMGAEVVYNHADYRLVSTRVLKEFSAFKEVNIFLRGMFPLVGFKSTSVYYERNERIAGKSHYPLSKMLGLAIDGITSLSIKPIRIITGLGIFVALLSFIGIIWSVIQFFTQQTVTGWASTVSIICFIGGIQLVSLGILGEYIGKIYMETKQRPRYIISERTQNMSDTTEK